MRTSTSSRPPPGPAPPRPRAAPRRAPTEEARRPAGSRRARPRRGPDTRGPGPQGRAQAPPEEPAPEKPPSREVALMGMLGWVMMGLAIWHFTIFLPDRFWGGIVGRLPRRPRRRRPRRPDHLRDQSLRSADPGRKGHRHRRGPLCGSRSPDRHGRGLHRGHAQGTRRTGRRPGLLLRWTPASSERLSWGVADALASLIPRFWRGTTPTAGRYATAPGSPASQSSPSSGQWP